MSDDGLDLLLFGTFDEQRHPRIAVLAEGLAARGHRIRRLNHPWAATTAERVTAVRDPRRAVVLVGRLLRAWALLVLGRRRIGPVDAVLVGYLGTLDVLLARLMWPRTVIVLDDLAPLGGTMQDRFPSRTMARLFGRLLDGAASSLATLTIVDTEEHRGRRRAGRTVVVPVGASQRWFDARVEAREAGPLRVIFYGLFTPLHGAVTIATALRAVTEGGADLDITLVGDGQDRPEVEASLAGLDVVWCRWIAPEELPALVASHDVCLGIFGTTPKARRVVPNKVYQGAAAGCAIITSDTAPQRRLLEDAAILIPPGDPMAIAHALQELATDAERTAERRSAAAEVADRAFRSDRCVEHLDRELRRRVAH